MEVPPFPSFVRKKKYLLFFMQDKVYTHVVKLYIIKLKGRYISTFCLSHLEARHFY